MKGFPIFKNPLVYLCFFYIIFVTLWINIIPFDKAPDEFVHYNYNVKFIIDNKKLPVSGVNDIELIKLGRENTFGKVQAIYSYNIYPQLNYIISAIFAVALNFLFHINYEIGARYASLFWGIIYIIFIYSLINKILNNKYKAFILTACFSFIPQIIFISSYTSQDIHSLAISALLCYMLICLVKEINEYKVNLSTIIKFSLSCALLLVTKMNYFIYIPFIAVYILWLTIIKKKLPNRLIIKMITCIFIISISLSGFWYLRNYLLYKDLIGQNFLLNEMSKYNPIGAEQHFNLDTAIFLIKNSGIFTIFKSAVAYFDYMSLGLDDYIYVILLALSFVILLSIFINIIEKKNNKLLKYLFFLSAFILSTFFLLIFNSIKFDLQLQGRYMFPIIVPIILFLALYIKEYEEFFKYMKIMLSIVVILLIMSTNLLIKTYCNYNLVPYKVEGAKQTDTSMFLDNVINTTVYQEVNADKNNLTEIDFNVATFQRENQEGVISLFLFDLETGDIIATQEIDLSNVSDNSTLQFKFIPIKYSKNKKYAVQIKATSDDKNNKLTFYTSNMDFFPDLVTKINESIVGQDISFVTYYRPEEYNN